MRTLSITVAGSLTIVLSALILAKPWVTIQHSEPIVVKGYSEQMVNSDSGSLTAEVTATAQANAQAYLQAGESLDVVRELASTALSQTSEILELGTSIAEVLKRDEKGNVTNEVDFYRCVRRIRISTTDVRGLEKLGRQIYDLNARGLSISVAGPEFYVSDLEQVKIDLLKAATENGKNRAETLATSSGQQLGSLVSAQQGVIQITKKNSSETSSWGIYDTETIEKVVKLVVTLEFEIR